MTNFDHKARIEEAKRILIDSWQRKAKAKPEELKRTYHSETHSDVGGRFAVVNRTVVTGRGEPPTYAAPNWASDPSGVTWYRWDFQFFFIIIFYRKFFVSDHLYHLYHLFQFKNEGS